MYSGDSVASLPPLQSLCRLFSHLHPPTLRLLSIHLSLTYTDITHTKHKRIHTTALTSKPFTRKTSTHLCTRSVVFSIIFFSSLLNLIWWNGSIHTCVNETSVNGCACVWVYTYVCMSEHAHLCVCYVCDDEMCVQDCERLSMLMSIWKDLWSMHAQ